MLTPKPFSFEISDKPGSIITPYNIDSKVRELLEETGATIPAPVAAGKNTKNAVENKRRLIAMPKAV